LRAQRPAGQVTGEGPEGAEKRGPTRALVRGDPSVFRFSPSLHGSGDPLVITTALPLGEVLSLARMRAGGSCQLPSRGTGEKDLTLGRWR
jgi:hypothetical protein